MTHKEASEEFSNIVKEAIVGAKGNRHAAAKTAMAELQKRETLFRTLASRLTWQAVSVQVQAFSRRNNARIVREVRKGAEQRGASSSFQDKSTQFLACARSNALFYCLGASQKFLKDATRKDILEEIAMHKKLERANKSRRNWLERILKVLPDNKTLVGDCLSKDDVERLKEAAAAS